jgi:hypothetical protein
MVEFVPKDKAAAEFLEMTDDMKKKITVEVLEELISKWRKRRPCHGKEECCCHGTCANELETLLRNSA